MLKLSEGKRFTVVADALSSTNRYVAGAILNGVALTRSFIRDAELRAGGELRFTMGPMPNKSWGSSTGARPFSMSTAR